MKAYRQRNKDDIDKAVYGLDIFTKNFCMNCKETDNSNDLVFKCKNCQFQAEDRKCLVKVFVSKHEHNYPLGNFGSMGYLKEHGEVEGKL